MRWIPFLFLLFCGQVLCAQNSVEWIDVSEKEAVNTLIALSAIPSPSGNERERAQFIATRMREIGVQDVTVDALFNVMGRIKGSSGKALVFITMLDDLPQISELQQAGFSARRIDERVVGPATEIQSTNAALLLAAEAILRSGITPKHDIIFASVAQEELGLVGMKALFEKLKDQTIAWVEVLGDGEKIFYGAPFIHWWKIIAKGTEGHTENDLLPSVNLGISCAVCDILALPKPSEETFINVGVIQSGKLYNRRPESGWFSLDIRSMNREMVQKLESQVSQILDQVKKRTRVHFEMEKVSLLDGGQIAGAKETHLIKLAEEISRSLGNRPVLSPKGCCNMIVPISQGSLAIGLHGNGGGDRGTVNEWTSVQSMIKMAKLITLLALNF